MADIIREIINIITGMSEQIFSIQELRSIHICGHGSDSDGFPACCFVNGCIVSHYGKGGCVKSCFGNRAGISKWMFEADGVAGFMKDGFLNDRPSQGFLFKVVTVESNSMA